MGGFGVGAEMTPVGMLLARSGYRRPLFRTSRPCAADVEGMQFVSARVESALGVTSSSDPLTGVYP